MREFQRFLPSGWAKRPETPVEALKAGKAVLEDEQNWVKAYFFQNDDPQLDPNDAYCNHWQVCALGAIGIVTIGNSREVPTSDDVLDGPWGIPSRFKWQFDEDTWEDPADKDLYDQAARILSDHLPEYEQVVEWGDGEETYTATYDSVPEFNDATETTHEQVMAVFDAAIAAAERLAAVL